MGAKVLEQGVPMLREAIGPIGSYHQPGVRRDGGWGPQLVLQSAQAHAGADALKRLGNRGRNFRVIQKNVNLRPNHLTRLQAVRFRVPYLVSVGAGGDLTFGPII